jgi:hypothetical protein
MDSEPKCKSCYVPMSEHMGLYATCEEVQRLIEDNKRLREALKKVTKRMCELCPVDRCASKGMVNEDYCSEFKTALAALEGKS